LKIKEEIIKSCEIEPEEKVFDIWNDERTSNFKAEIHAMSLENYIRDNIKFCTNLKDKKLVQEWLISNRDILDGSAHSIKTFIANKMMLTGPNATKQVWVRIQYLLGKEYQKLSYEYDGGKKCEANFSKLVSLETLWPFNEVYKTFSKPFESSELQEKYWKEALQVISEKKE
jgi:hypothetical protein